MKRISLISMMAAVSFAALAQDNNAEKAKAPVTCKPFSLGIPLGIGANAGMVGVGAEYGFAKHFSVGAGAGIGSWGYKYFGEAKYYFSDNCFKGSALGLAYTYATGASDLELKNAATTSGTKDVTVDQEPVSNLALAYYHYWGLGKRRVNRFYLSVGYSVCLSPVNYTVKGYTLTSKGDAAMNVLAPGGIVLGLGWYFGL